MFEWYFANLCGPAAWEINIPFFSTGLMTNTLLKKFEMRTVGVFGAVLFSLPNVGLAFVNNVYEMAFLNFLQGMGLGLIVTICNTNFNAYFVKRRASVRKCKADGRRSTRYLYSWFFREIFAFQVMSAAQVIVGLGGIAYPICIEKLMKVYGFRGKMCDKLL